jgi:hypothetical protein
VFPPEAHQFTVRERIAVTFAAVAPEVKSMVLFLANFAEHEDEKLQGKGQFYQIEAMRCKVWAVTPQPEVEGEEDEVR